MLRLSSPFVLWFLPLASDRSTRWRARRRWQKTDVTGGNLEERPDAESIGQRMGNHQGLCPRAKARSRAGGADDENGITEKVTARAVAFSRGVDIF